MDDRNTGWPDMPSILREVAGEDLSGTHSSQCWTWHPGCALHAAADEIERLRAASDGLVAAIRNHDLSEEHIKAWEQARRG